MIREKSFSGILLRKRIFHDALLFIARGGFVRTNAFLFTITASALAATGLVTRSQVTYG